MNRKLYSPEFSIKLVRQHIWAIASGSINFIRHNKIRLTWDRKQATRYFKVTRKDGAHSLRRSAHHPFSKL